MAKDIRILNGTIYMSARDLLPQFSYGAQLGHDMAVRKFNSIWGGADAGEMGAVPKTAFTEGGFTLGVAHTGLKDREPPSQYATFLTYRDEFYDRIDLMQSGADFIVALVGGFGTQQEIYRAIRAIEAGDINNIPIFIVNPTIDGGRRLYDDWKRQIELLRSRGYLKPHVKITFVENPAEALRLAEAHYENMPDAEWRAHKNNQLIYTPPHDALLISNGSFGFLRHDPIFGTDKLKDGQTPRQSHYDEVIRPDMVAVIGHSSGASSNYEENEATYALIPDMIEALANKGKSLITIRSNRGTNELVTTFARLKKCLGLSVFTEKCILDGRVDLSSIHVPNSKEKAAQFSSQVRMSGFIKRRAKYIFCLPGADADVADLLCEISVDSKKFADVEVYLVSPNGEYDNVIAQNRLLSEMPLAFKGERVMGTTSPGVLPQIHVLRSKQDVLRAIESMDSAGASLRVASKMHDIAHISVDRHIANLEAALTGFNPLDIGSSQDSLGLLRSAMNGSCAGKIKPKDQKRIDQALAIAAQRRNALVRGRA